MTSHRYGIGVGLVLGISLSMVACGSSDTPVEPGYNGVSTAAGSGGIRQGSAGAAGATDPGKGGAGGSPATGGTSGATVAGAGGNAGLGGKAGASGAAGVAGRAGIGGTGGKAGAAGAAGASGAASPCAVMVNDADCDKTKRPIVFIHGTVGSGDNFATPAQLFASNGYCPDRMKAIEYNSLLSMKALTENPWLAVAVLLGNTAAGGLESYDDAVGNLNALIDELSKLSPDGKVDLMGHSQGAIWGNKYTRENPTKIAHYIHLAGGALTEDPNGVPTLCLSSQGDTTAGPVTCTTTKNVTFEDDHLDHFAVAASNKSFVEMYKFLNDDKEPKYAEVQCGDPITIEGRAVTFGDSQIVAGAKIEVYELGSDPRQRGNAVATWTVPADGFVGPWKAKRGVTYEYKLTPPAGDSRPVRYSYMVAPIRSDRLVRFLFQSTDESVNTTTSQVNLSDDHAVFVARYKKGAFFADRDNLEVDGFKALNSDNANSTTVTVGLYLFDAAPGNQKSDGGSIFSGSFVNSSDVYMQSKTPAFIEVKFNNQVLKVPNWPSKTHGMSLLLFE